MSCLAQFVVLLLCHVTFASLVEAFFILSIHTALFLPFEVARGLYRNTQFFSARQRMTLFQAVVFSYVRVAFGYVSTFSCVIWRELDLILTSAVRP